MRIVISGSHRTGKTTLAAALAERLTRHVVVDEPYYGMLEEGHEFPATPTADDFELLLERSLASLFREIQPNTLFDRCPADYLAYLVVLMRRADLLDDWFTRSRDALDRLDLVVFVPIEAPDRVRREVIDAPRLRRAVDALLRELLIDNVLDCQVPVMEVSGSSSERADQVMARIDTMQRPRSSAGSPPR
jgi:predicted ATPase